MTVLTVKQIVLRITIIISVVEFLIMLGLAMIPHHLEKNIEALVDVAILVAVSAPVIYLWVIKPFVIARNEVLSRITDMAYSDQLTNLPNRRFFKKYIEKFMADSIRHHYYGALLLLDLDDFKPVNDRYGHDAGDAVLVEVANRLLASVREGDLVVRMGGDEFIILLSRLGSDASLASKEAIAIAEKLQHKLGKMIAYKNLTLQVGASVGVRLIGTRQEDINFLVQQADKAMYLAKKDGKGGIELSES